MTLKSLLALALLVASLVSASPTVENDLAKRTTYVSARTTLTFFGYPDNCDSTGCYKDEKAYSCSNPNGSGRPNKSSGDGSYNNPLTVAFHPGGVFSKCMIVYIGYLQKFGIVEGYCASCAGDHLDVWVESSCHANYNAVCGCENKLTPGRQTWVYYNIKAEDPNVWAVWKGTLYNDKQQCTGQVATSWETRRLRCNASSQEQSVNPALERSAGVGLATLDNKWLLSKRQTGECRLNTCQCPGC